MYPTRFAAAREVTIKRSALRSACLTWLAVMLFMARLAATPVAAHDGPTDAPPAVGAAELYAPTPMPDRIVLTWNGNPSVSQAVSWRTSTVVQAAFAEIGPAGDNAGFAAKAKRITAETVPFKSDLSECHLHSVTFTELKPGTKYAYRVGDGTNWSEWFHFRTAASEPEPFSFIYFGDAQNDLRSMWSRVIREAYSDAPKAAFTLHAGDLVNRGEDDACWGEWFGAGSWINAMIPVIATPGNHEYPYKKNPDGTRIHWLSKHWGAQFAFPTNGPEGLTNSVHYVDYQNLRVISLNSNELREEQVPWLERVLSENDRTWTVLTFHHPIFSMAANRDNVALRDLWKPVFDRHRVDLVLTGHDHAYGRSRQLLPESNVPSGSNWRSAPGGTVYVVSVSGPKMYNLERPSHDLIIRAAEDTQLYQIISIDGSFLRYEARTASGEIYDSFTLEKQPGKPNLMTEQVPNSPERRRPKKPAEAAAK